MSGLFLGIDTSNYTTSASLCENGKVLKNEKIPVTVQEGERGIRQSGALFEHTKNIPVLLERIGKADIAAVGVSDKPRDAEGSYMPCFLAGVSAASSIASLMGVPLYRFSHQRGHIMAAVYSSGMPAYDRFIAFHVSGGTTEMLLWDNGNISIIGKTRDINAGQLIDRIGVLMGLPFPAGKHLEPLCDFDGVKPRATVTGCECNLSGLENIASDMYAKGMGKQKVGAFIIASIELTLSRMTENAMALYGRLPLLYAGGVMSNSYIQNRFRERYGAFFAEPAFSADNAAGIALLTEKAHEGGNGVE